MESKLSVECCVARLGYPRTGNTKEPSSRGLFFSTVHFRCLARDAVVPLFRNLGRRSTATLLTHSNTTRSWCLAFATSVCALRHRSFSTIMVLLPRRYVAGFGFSLEREFVSCANFASKCMKRFLTFGYMYQVIPPHALHSNSVSVFCTMFELLYKRKRYKSLLFENQ